MDERITSMIPHYGKLNKIYTEIMSGGKGYPFEKFCEIWILKIHWTKFPMFILKGNLKQSIGIFVLCFYRL